MQNHCLAAKGAGSFLDQFSCKQGWVQLGQERAAELLQLANFILVECCQSHRCLLCSAGATGELTSALDLNDSS